MPAPPQRLCAREPPQPAPQCDAGHLPPRSLPAELVVLRAARPGVARSFPTTRRQLIRGRSSTRLVQPFGISSCPSQASIAHIELPYRPQPCRPSSLSPPPPPPPLPQQATPKSSSTYLHATSEESWYSGGYSTEKVVAAVVEYGVSCGKGGGDEEMEKGERTTIA